MFLFVFIYSYHPVILFKKKKAIELLQNQIAASKAKLAELNEDLFFLRGNSITVEVNMARLFNHSVKLKKAREALTIAAPPVPSSTSTAATTATITAPPAAEKAIIKNVD